MLTVSVHVRPAFGPAASAWELRSSYRSKYLVAAQYRLVITPKLRSYSSYTDYCDTAITVQLDLIDNTVS